MSAATQGVLLRYAGGEVYALPTAEPHVWRVAGIDVHVGIVAEHAETGEVIGLETLADLASAATHARRLADESAERARVAAKVTRTSKSKRRTSKRGSRG